MASERKTNVFISYSRKDIDFAQKLNEHLAADDIHPLLDKTDIAPGEDWQHRLARLITEADAVVFCVSQHSAKSEICKWEISEATRLGKRIVPVIIAKVQPALLPEQLTRLNFIFFAGEKYQDAYTKLKFALETDLPWIREHTRLAELATTWATRNKATSLLLRGPALTEAEKWIASQPHNASTPTELHREFIAKSRSSVTSRQRYSVMAALVVAVVSLGLFVWGEINRREATAQKERAERNLNTATQTANDIVFELANKFRTTKGIPLETTKDILGRAAQLQDNLLKSGEFLPELQRGQAVSLNSLSETFRALGDSQTALGLAQQAAQIMEALIKKDDTDIGWKNDLGTSYINVARAQNNLDDVRPILEKARELLEFALAKQPDNLIWKRNLSIVEEDIGQNLGARNKRSEALEHILKARDLRLEIDQKSSDDKDNTLALSISAQNIGDTLLALARLPEAIASYRSSLDIIQKLSESDTANTAWQNQLTFSQDKLSNALLQAGYFDEALKYTNASVTLLTTLVATDASNAEWSRHLANSLYKLADLQMRMATAPDALESLQTALNITQRLSTVDPQNLNLQNDLAHAYNKLGNFYEAQKNLDLALTNYEQAYTVTRANLSKNQASNDLLHSLSLIGKSIGDIYVRQGKFADAAKAYDEALRVAEKELATTPNDSIAQRQLLVLHGAFGDLYASTNQMPKAIDIYREVSKEIESYARNSPEDMSWRRDLAVSYSKLADAGDNRKANYSEALKIFKELQSTNRIEPSDLSLIPLLEDIIAKLPTN